MHQQLVARAALVSRSKLCIQELQSRWWRRPISSSSSAPGPPPRRAARGRATTSAGREVDPLVRRRQPLRAAGRPAAGRGRRRPGRARSFFIVTPLARGAAAVRSSSVGLAVSRAPLDEPLLAAAALPAEPGGGAQGDLAEDLPVVALVALLLEHGRGEARRVADGQQVEDEVVVVALERRGRRQDHVGVPGGLVDVDVDGGHEVEARAAPRSRRVPSGVDSTGLPATVSRARTWPSPGVSISSRSTETGQLAGRLRQAAHPAAPDVVVAAADQPGADGVDRRGGEHRAALAVEVAGEHVEAVDRPLAHRAEPRAGRDARSGRRPRRASAAASSRASRRISSAGTPLIASARSGVKSATRSTDRRQPVDVRRRGWRRALGEQDVQHRQQHPRVGAGADEVVLVGDLGGLGAARVEDDHPAAARLEVAQPVREVGHRHQRAVGRHRVGAEHQEVRRAVDVGDREQQLVAEHAGARRAGGGAGRPRWR